jgi:hypothetical protein
VTCPSLERLGAWFLDAAEDDESGRIEEHIFSCDRCAGRAERLEALIQRLRSALPPILTPERREALERAVADLPKTPVSPGETATLEFRKGTEIGFWVMHHDLSGAERVDCQLLGSDGSALVLLPDVPFDADRQEVVLACHVHYRNLGTEDVRARLTSFDGTGQTRTAEYRLIHRFFDPPV